MRTMIAFAAALTVAASSAAGAVPTPLIDTLNEQAGKMRQAAANRCLPPPVFRWHPGYKVPPQHRPWVIRVRRDRLAALRARASRCAPWYVTTQIRVATIIGPMHVDAWPNCPDPFDSRSYTWTDTVRCENGGSWLDSPGYYRCGLQFDPGWERRYGRLCP